MDHSGAPRKQANSSEETEKGDVLAMTTAR
jgi:hypothetical protein